MKMGNNSKTKHVEKKKLIIIIKMITIIAIIMT